MDGAAWFRCKTADEAVAETNEAGSRLRSELNVVELTAIGLAIVVGAGIFSVAPQVYGAVTGPSIVLSFLVAALTCSFVAVCFSVCASRIPVSGSVYTFVHVTLGQCPAWVVSWLLVLEYTIGAAVIAQTWSLYVQQLVHVRTTRGGVDLAAIGVVVLVVALLRFGLRAASRFTLAVTAVKVLTLIVAVVVGALLVDPHHEAWFGPSPPRYGEYHLDRPWFAGFVPGVVTGAAFLFYPFIGFDSVSTVAEEARFPRRALRLGIYWTLGIATVLYVAVGLVLWGAISPEGLGSILARTGGTGPILASVFDRQGPVGLVSWAIEVGAIIGLVAGIVALLLGQSRIVVAMGRDRFVPEWTSRLDWRRTPSRALWSAGALCAAAAGFVPQRYLQSIVNQGTLLLFIAACVAAWRLSGGRLPWPRARADHGAPETRDPAERRRRVVAVLGILTSLLLIAALASLVPTLTVLGYIVVAIGVYAAVRPRLGPAEPHPDSVAEQAARPLVSVGALAELRWPGGTPSPAGAPAAVPSTVRDVRDALDDQWTPRTRRLAELAVDADPAARGT